MYYRLIFTCRSHKDILVLHSPCGHTGSHWCYIWADSVNAGADRATTKDETRPLGTTEPAASGGRSATRVDHVGGEGDRRRRGWGITMWGLRVPTSSPRSGGGMRWKRWMLRGRGGWRRMLQRDGFLMKVFEHFTDGSEGQVLNLTLAIRTEGHSQVLCQKRQQL